MFVFGHIGITVFVARKLKKDIDTRKVAALSLLADFIDKPIGLLYPEKFGQNTRIAAHTLIACILVYGLTRAHAWHKKSKFTYVYAASYFTHMILDVMWRGNELIIFLWPFLGAPADAPQTALKRWQGSWKTPYNLSGEIIGLSILVYFFFSRKLSSKKKLDATG